MKAIDLSDESDTKELKALVYGRPGTGKTSFGVSAPRPLILLNERQAVPHIRGAARRLGVPMPAVLYIESLEDYRNVLRGLHGDKGRPFVVMNQEGAVVLQLEQWPLSVVLDSATEMCDLVSKEIRELSPQKSGKDGLPIDSERYWNVFSDRTIKLIRAFRDVPLNILFLCLLADKEVGEGDEKSRWVGPRMAMRAFPDALAAAVNVVGVTYRRRLEALDANGDRKLEYGIATTGQAYMELKPYRPLRDHEVMNFASWCQRINGVDDGSQAPAPMDPTAIGDVVDDAPATPTPTAAAGTSSSAPAAAGPATETTTPPTSAASSPATTSDSPKKKRDQPAA